jgi:hypothetical protein
LSITQEYETVSLNLSKDTPDRGMSMYIKDSLKYTPREFEYKFDEAIFCELELKNNDKLLVGGIYSSSSCTDENFTGMCKTIRKV